MAGTVLKSYRWRNGEWVFQYQSIAGNGGKYKCTLGPENVYGWMRLTAEKPDFSLWSIDFLYEPIQVPYVEIDPEMLHGFIEEKQPR